MDRVMERAWRGGGASGDGGAGCRRAGSLSAGFWAPTAFGARPYRSQPVDVMSPRKRAAPGARGPARGRMPPRTACCSARRSASGDKAATASQSRR
jgi:hypothetical protein